MPIAHERHRVTSDQTEASSTACNLSALDAATRAEHIALARSLLTAGGARLTDSPHEVAFELPASRYLELARFVENERRCCAHLRFQIEIPPSGAAIELRIVGEGVREGLAAIVSLSSATALTRDRL